MTDAYDGEPVDWQVGVYALRTFAIHDGVLGSVALGAGNWHDGTCVAEHQGAEADHEVPSAGCSCGIYGAFSLTHLAGQYPEQAHRIVAVIAAEGSTIRGRAGIRTVAARVVAYWCAEPADDDEQTEEELCAAQFPGARRYYNIRVMTRIYGLRR
jgi:hypothetical protein